MNPIHELNAWLRTLERRLRMLAISRGAAIAAAVALVCTLALVVVTNRFAFSATSMSVARVALFLCLALAIAFGLVIPVFRLNRRRAAREAEHRCPELQERLLTIAERPSETGPFAELLAADALQRVRSTRTLTRPWLSVVLSSVAMVSFVILLWLALAGPGWLGYGTSLLWAGTSRVGNVPFYDIVVAPGNRTVRKRSDQLITARLAGFSSNAVRLYARFGGASKWQEAQMQPQPESSAFEFLFAGITDPIEYYVAAGAVRSRSYTLKVVDLPGVRRIRITYHYPSWAGMKDSVEDPGGDIRAVEGTEAQVDIETDKPLQSALLALDDNSQIRLEARDGNWLTARVPVEKDGMYHVAAIDHGDQVRLSDDYFIEAKKDSPPEVKMLRPQADVHANPVEEVTVAVEANDDFALNGVELHYSVNGAPEKIIGVPGSHGTKHAEGKVTLALEDFQLQPGDVVSVYALARDARHVAKSDIHFIQAEPFERNYSQAQSSGNGEDQDEDQNNISTRQKEVIAATFNALRDAKNSSEAAEDAAFLSGAENKLAAQAKSLADRMRKRELADTSEQFKKFSEDMDKAAQAMTEAAGEMRAQRWTNALTPEQKGLQNLLRAEATFRDIRVAFGSSSGSGSGNAGRDLGNMFDLELDTQKNQYETGQQSASPDARAKQIDEAMQRLEQLARRQQELAEQQRKQPSFEQRWQQEMLRREAEQLRQQMQQMAQQRQQSGSPSQQSQQQRGQQGQQGQQSQQGDSSQQGRTGSMTNQRLEEAIQRLQRAADDMRNASSDQGNAAQRRAAERLQEARDMMAGMEQQQAASSVKQMADRAAQIAEQQRDFERRLRREFGGENGDRTMPGQSTLENENMAKEHERTADQLKQLEQQLTNEQRALAGGQPAIASRLRDALADLQQNELAMRMKKNAEWIRRGLGGTTWGREALITQGTDRLNDQLQEAQASLGERGQQGNRQKGAGPGKEDLERALAQVEALRQKAEQMSRQIRPVRPRSQPMPGGSRSNPVPRGTRRRAEV